MPINNKYPHMKNTTELKPTWAEQKGKLKQRFAILTDNDLMLNQDNKDVMLGKI